MKKTCVVVLAVATLASSDGRAQDGRSTLEAAAKALGLQNEIGAIADADVVYVLRMQRERMLAGAAFVPSLREYTALYGITPERVRPGQVVMHPGPMNRGVEIDPRVADSPAALVTTQVRAGLVVRMAVLYDLLTSGPAGTSRVRLGDPAEAAWDDLGTPAPSPLEVA